MDKGAAGWATGAIAATLMAASAGAGLAGVQPAAVQAASAQPASSDPFAKCREWFAREPQNYDAAYCFYDITFSQRLWDAGAREFERLIGEQPDNYWLPMAYGHVYRARDPDRAEALYRRAADGFRASGHAEGEILARSNLRNFLFPKAGRLADAAAEMRRVAEIGASVDDPILKARAWALEATHAQETGDDLLFAYGRLKQATDVVFPDGPYRLQRTTLISLGNVAYRMGRLDEALDVFRRLERVSAAAGELLVQATARYNILSTATLKERHFPSPNAARDLLELAQASLETAIAAQNLDITLKSHLAIAELLAIDARSRPDALSHVQRCLALSVTLSQADDEAMCAWMKAALVRGTDPDEARAAERRALRADARSNNPATHAYSAGQRMRASWDAAPRERAVEHSIVAIDAIESLRRLQDRPASSAELFSTWTSHYYWLSGRLLDLPSPDLPFAFSIVERMRSRSLLDALARARPRPDPAHPAMVRRQQLREAIARVQRTLLDPSLAAPDRRELLAQLERLEIDEREADRQVALSASTRQPGADLDDARDEFPSLATLQQALAPNEALLSFQVGLWNTYDRSFGGGSWLVAVTRGGSSAHRIPDRVALAPMVPMFAGMLERADGLDRTAAVRLYDDLLAEALGTLPDGIDRLVVVPDGDLHHLPFDALRPAADAPPLAARYELVIAPSATLWMRWRHGGRAHSAGRAGDRATPPTRVLVFADPLLDAAIQRDADVRGSALQEGVRLGRLPYARREGRAIERYVPATHLAVGDQASERALKRTALAEYDVIHFAAHAVADEARPERSAVVLAPGGAEEDGLLQPREIEALDLTGRVVVLSACQTASGAVLSGEGVLSLARPFFSAGAVAVVGNRWPIRDEDSAFLFDAFYRSIAAGATLAGAVKAARVAAIDAGRPASVWASLVLLGDGGVQMMPDRGALDAAHRPVTAPLLFAVVAAGAVLAAGFALFRRTRRR